MRFDRPWPQVLGLPASRAETLRALGGLVSIVLIFGQLLVLLHFVLVPHRLCPLHGLEDVSVSEAHAQRLDRRDAPDVRAGHPVATRSRVPDDGHDRCFLTCCPKESLRAAQATRAERFPTAVVPSTDREAAPRQPLLLLAPKQGPPVRALA